MIFSVYSNITLNLDAWVYACSCTGLNFFVGVFTSTSSVCKFKFASSDMKLNSGILAEPIITKSITSDMDQKKTKFSPSNINELEQAIANQLVRLNDGNRFSVPEEFRGRAQTT